jgi:pimeloyl-ACP methyl ester carboxylesterase
MEQRTVDVAGRRVRWQTTGVGPPLVCVHGLAASSNWWQFVLPALAERHEVHLLDVPRFSARSRFRPREAADWLAGWLEASGLVRPVLIGHSFGGLLAAKVAARTELDRLVLVAPAGLPWGRSFVRDAAALAASGRATRSFSPTLAADALRSGFGNLVRGGLYARAEDVRAELVKIRVPTLIVWGDRDAVVPFRVATAWRDAIPGSRLAVVAGAAHIPFVQSPSAFLDAVSDFLDAPSAGVAAAP